MRRKPANRVLSALDRHLGQRRPEEIRVAVGKFSLGLVLLALGEAGVVAILIGDGEAGLLRRLQARFPKARLSAGDEEAKTLAKGLVASLEDPKQELALPLDLRGTVFQKRVWLAIREIPPGTTSTYAAIAREIGAPKAIRAVGGACAVNPLAFAVPCHRVLRSDGSSAGGDYWGKGRLQVLLKREAAAASQVSRPAR